MRDDDDDQRDWDRTLPMPAEAELLLNELQHRVSNEVACSIAAMQLVKVARGKNRRYALLDQALERMQGFGDVHTVLSARPNRAIDISVPLDKLCRGLVAGRTGLDQAAIRLALQPTLVDGYIAHRLLLIASEIIFNAVRHALIGRVGSVTVRLDSDTDHVRLLVADNGPGIRANAQTSGTGLGSEIVARLVRGIDGRLECDSDSTGTVIRVFVPSQDDDVPF